MIREWLAWGFEPPIVIIGPLSLDEAVTYEKALIGAIGRRDLGLGSLTNQNDGHKLDDLPPFRRVRGIPTEASLNRDLRLRNPGYSPRVPRTKAIPVPQPPKSTQPCWIKPLKFEVSPEQGGWEPAAGPEAATGWANTARWTKGHGWHLSRHD
jgi:hypothetical protein